VRGEIIVKEHFDLWVNACVCVFVRERVCVCAYVCICRVSFSSSGDFNQEKESIKDTDREGGYRCRQKKSRVLILGERNDFPLRLYEVLINIMPNACSPVVDLFLLHFVSAGRRQLYLLSLL